MAFQAVSVLETTDKSATTAEVPIPTAHEANKTIQENIERFQTNRQLISSTNGGNEKTETGRTKIIDSGNSISKTDNRNIDNINSEDNINSGISINKGIIAGIELGNIDISVNVDKWNHDEKKHVRYASDDDDDKDSDDYNNSKSGDGDIDPNIVLSFEDIYDNVAVKFGSILTTLLKHDKNGFLFDAAMIDDNDSNSDSNENEKTYDEKKTETKEEEETERQKEKGQKNGGLVDVNKNDKLKLKEILCRLKENEKLSMPENELNDTDCKELDIEHNLSLCEISLHQIIAKISENINRHKSDRDIAVVGGVDSKTDEINGIGTDEKGGVVVSTNTNHKVPSIFSFSNEDQNVNENKNEIGDINDNYTSDTNERARVGSPSSGRSLSAHMGYARRLNSIHSARSKHIDRVETDLGLSSTSIVRDGDYYNRIEFERNIKNMDNKKKLKEYFDLEKNKERKKKKDNDDKTDNDTGIGNVNNKNKIVNLPIEQWNWKQVVNWLQNQMISQVIINTCSTQDSNEKLELKDTEDMKQFFYDFAKVCYGYKIDGRELMCLTSEQIEMLVESKRNEKNNKNNTRRDETRIAQMATSILLNEIRQLRTGILFIRFYKLLWNRLDSICGDDNQDQALVDDIKYVIKQLRYKQLQQDGPYLNDNNWNSNAPFLTKIDCFISYLIMPPMVKYLVKKTCSSYLIDLAMLANCYNNKNKQEKTKDKKNNSNDSKQESVVLNGNGTQSNNIIDGLETADSQNKKWTNKRNWCNCATMFGTLLIKFLIPAIITAIFTIYWYKVNVFSIVDSTFTKAMASTSERTITDVEHELGSAQSALLATKAGLKNNDFGSELLNIHNGNYDEVCGVFRYANWTNIYECFVFAFDDYNGSSIIGMRRNQSDSTHLVVMAWDGHGLTEYDYDERSRTRTIGTPYPDFMPSNRSWYKVVMNGTVNYGDMVWTDKYEFAGGNKVNGMTLVQKIKCNNLTVILGVGFTVSNLRTVLKKYSPPLHDGFVYLATEDNVELAANVNDGYEDLKEEAIEYFYNHSDTITNNTETVTINTGKMNVSISPFYMVLPSQQSDHSVLGHVVIGYTDKYREGLEKVQAQSTVITEIMVVVIVIISGILSITSTFELRLNEKIANKLRKMQNMLIWVKILFKRNYNEIISWSTCCSYFLSGWIFICLCLIYSIWYVEIEDSYVVLKNTVSGEEHLHVMERIEQFIEDAKKVSFIIEERFNRGDMIKMPILETANGTTVDGYDSYFWNLMRSFVSNSGETFPFRFDVMYVGTSTGEFGGGGRREKIENKAKIAIQTISVQDSSTSHVYIVYGSNDDGTRDITKIYYEDDEYDVRCRDWYINAIKFTFNGSFEQAFPDMENYREFVDSARCPAAVKSYEDIFGIINITEGNSTYYYGTRANHINISSTNDIDGDFQTELAWSRYVFANGEDVGLTASIAIQNKTTGDLIAVIGIDYTLKSLSDFLGDSIADDESIANQSIAFVFAFETSFVDNESSINNESLINNTISIEINNETYSISNEIDEHKKFIKYPVIASTNGLVDVLIFPDEISGLACISDAVEAWQATAHLQPLIRIYSKVIVDVIGILNGKLSTNIRTSDNVSPIIVSLDLPDMMASMITYNAENLAGIVWIGVSAIDLTDQDRKIRHVQLTTLIAWVAFGLAVFYGVRITNQNGTRNNNSDDHSAEYEHNKDSIAGLTEAISKTIGKVVQQAFIQEFWFKVNEKQDVLNEDIRILDNTRDFARELSHTMITMNYVKHVALETATHHFSYLEDSTMAYNMDKMMIHTVLSAEKGFGRQWLLFLFSSVFYDAMIEIVIFCHVTTAFGECDTQKQLSDKCDNNESSYPFGKMMLGIKLICIIIEWIDLFIQFMVAELRLKARNDANYSISALIINHRRRLLALFLANVLTLLNFVLINVSCIGIFSYYIPIVPILLIIRNDYIYNAMKYFIIALNYGKYVLITYVWYMFVATILGMALFSQILDGELIDSYKDALVAFVSTFIALTTTANLNDLLHALFKQSVTLVVFLLMIIMVALFIAIPVLIHIFEQSYHEQIKQNKKLQIKQKLNAIVSAFLVMDLDNDGVINRNECMILFNLYNIENNINCNHNNLCQNEDNNVDIHTFVSCIMDHEFSNQISQKSIKLGRLDRDEFQAYMECNLFGNAVRSQAITLAFGLFPAGVAGTLYNFEQVPISVLNVMFILSYVMQIMELVTKMYVYGFSFRRYLYFDSYPNPPLIESAINLIRYPNKVLVNLTKDQISWIKENLAKTDANVRYLSELQNSNHKKQIGMANRFDFCIILISVVGLLTNINYNYNINDQSYNLDSEIKRVRFWLLFPLWRVLTVIDSNRRMVFAIGRVIAAGHVLPLLSFLILFIFIWARIGAALFNKADQYVPPEVYDPSTHANFNSLPNAILALLQMTVGEGWHEIMYLNVISTRYVYILYFVVFVIIVTLLLNNIFIGLFLAGIDELNDRNFNQRNTQFLNREYHYQSEDDKEKRIQKLKLELRHLGCEI